MDLAFIRLYLNDFSKAKMGDDSNAVEIAKRPFIQQSPCETFVQFSNCKDGVSFVGSIKVELITCNGTVKLDVSDYFYYDTYVLNGLPQIRFEFGKIGIDYWTNLAIVNWLTDLFLWELIEDN